MSKCWYCNEELTTANYCDEHIGICTKCYSSMFKVSNDFVKCLIDKISVLEAKLAESEKQNKDLEDDHNKLIDQYDKRYDDLCKEIQFHSSARERFVKKVKELEQQLTEKQSKIQELNDMYENLLVAKGTENELMQVSADCDFFAKENRKLKQQLAEKEKAHMEAMQNALNDFLTLRQELNEDKILFAITELKKAREIAYEDWLLDGCCNLTLARFLDKIDNQIEELKKEMK